jgi:hypothetical protein
MVTILYALGAVNQSPFGSPVARWRRTVVLTLGQDNPNLVE